MTNSTASIIEYLDSKEINWFPINLEVIDKKKELKYTYNYMPKQTDFKTLSLDEIKERQKYLKDFPFIAIDTNLYNQIDVDTDEHFDEVEALKERLPYFLSASKGYPHLFCMFHEPIENNRVQTTFEGIEVLSGQWSYCKSDAVVCNADVIIPHMKNAFIKGNKSQIDNTVNKQPLSYSKVNIDEVLNHIDIKYCDSYDSWLRICAALVNSGFSFETFDKFSQRSKKYSYNAVSKYWNELNRNPLEAIQFGTIMYYLKQSDIDHFYKIHKELKTTNQLDEITKLISTGNLNHSNVAKIFYEAFNWKYQYSNGHWYRLSKGGIYQKLTKDPDVHISKEIKEYLQKVLMDVVNNTTDDDKRKKLWAALGKIESNSFKLSCVSEAKQDFMNENLFKELDMKDHLIGFTNGVYDLETMSFRVGNVEDKISMTTGYDYSSDYDNEKFEFIDTMINGYFETAETARWFKKHLGSLLIGGNKEEKGYFWVGNGRNGKGTIDSLLINTLGNYYYKLHNEFFTASKQKNGGAEPEILSMQHKRLCMTHEPEGSTKYLTSKFKTSTGNDLMSARAMYSDNIEHFKPSHKTIIQTNHLPEFTDIDHGLLSRLIVINFPFKFCDTNDFDPDNRNHKMIDQELKGKLKSMENVFMNFLLKWYQVYETEGLEDQSLEIKASVVEYRKEVDSVKTFIEEGLEKTNKSSDRISTNELRTYHNDFAKNKLNANSFGKRLKANGLEVLRLEIDGKKVSCISYYKYKEGFKEDLETDKKELKCLVMEDEE